MPRRVTYGQLRYVLKKLGFRETRQPEGIALKHAKSDTWFLFRPYEEHDRIRAGEVSHVTMMLDLKGLLEPESFQVLLTKAQAQA